MDQRRDTLLAPPLEPASTVSGEIEGNTERTSLPPRAEHHGDPIAELRGVRPLTRPPFRPWTNVHDRFDPADE